MIVALVIEQSLRVAWRARRYKQLHNSDGLSVAAIAIAERIGRVLIVSPVKPVLAMASSIAHKPSAIRYRELIDRETNIVSEVSEFCRFRQSRFARARKLSPPRPFVILHDLNYYFGDEINGQLGPSARAEAEDAILQIDQILRGYGGESIVVASGYSNDATHTEWLTATGWTPVDPFSMEQIVNRRPLSKKNWIHPPLSRRPPEYKFGPLEGLKKDVASWLFPDGKPDHRRLRTPAQNGTIWVTQPSRYRVAVYFRTQSQFAEANRRRLECESRAVRSTGTSK